jgi:hypothetical protein
VVQEPPRLVELELDIVLAGLGPEADFFDLGLMRVRLAVLLFLLVLEFAEVHDSANGRALVGRDFDEIQIRLASSRHRLIGRHDSQLRPIGADHANRRNPNLVIDPL